MLLLAAVAAAPAQAQRTAAPGIASQAPASESSEISALIDKKQWDDALKRADAHLTRNPRDVQVRFLRGVILGESARPLEAILVFEGLTQDFPELPEPYNNLGVLYAAQGRYEKAREQLGRAIAAQPGYVTALENLGDLYVAMAIDAYQQAVKLDPANRTAPAKLALARELRTRVQAVR